MTALGLSPAEGTASPIRPVARKPNKGASKPTSRILRTSLDGGGGVGPGAAEDDRGRLEGAQGALQPLVAKLGGEHQHAEAGAAQGEIECLGVNCLGVLSTT